MRLAMLFAVLATLALAAPAGAQTPSPRPTGAMGMRHVPIVNGLANPANRKYNPGTMSGQGCMSGPMAARSQTAINPITGKAQAAPIVSIPIGGGSVAGATTRAQQRQACAHPH